MDTTKLSLTRLKTGQATRAIFAVTGKTSSALPTDGQRPILGTVRHEEGLDSRDGSRRRPHCQPTRGAEQGDRVRRPMPAEQQRQRK